MKTTSKINLMVSVLAAIALGCVIGCDQRDSDLTFTDEPMLSAPAPSERSITYTIPEWGVRFGSVQSVENYPIWTTNAANKVYALATGINNYKWDWTTQVTNKPNVLTSESDPTIGWTNGTLYVHGDTIDPVQYQQDGSVRIIRLIASGTMDGAELNSAGFVQGAGVTIPTGAGIYSAVLGLNAISTHQFAFVYSGRGENQYHSHGNGTFNIDPVGGASGFWIGETNLATYLANAGSGEHTHSNLVNGTTQVIANRNGTASISAISPPTYSLALQNQLDGSTWNWNIVFLGYMMVGGEKTEIDLDDMITTRGSLGGLTDIRVSITQQGTGAVVAQEQTITLVPYNENAWQFGNNLVLEPAFSSVQSYFTSMGPPFSITYLETTGGDSPYNYTFGSQFGPLSGSTGMFLSGGGPSLKTIATVDQIPTIPTLATVATSGSYNDLLNKPTNVSAFNNDAGYVKTNAQGTLVVGSNQMQPNGGSWSLVIGGAGSHTKSDNTIILSPGSNIGTNSHYSAVFGPGAYIHDNAQYSFAFGGGINIQDNCNDSFVVGSGAQSAHKCAFLWSANSNGGRSIPAQPTTHGNGTFNINTYDGVAGVYIGDTNLQQIIRLEAKAMIHDAVSGVNVNLQSAEDTRVALTNLITILKNL